MEERNQGLAQVFGPRKDGLGWGGFQQEHISVEDQELSFGLWGRGTVEGDVRVIGECKWCFEPRSVAEVPKGMSADGEREQAQD